MLIIVLVAVVLVLAGGGYYYWKTQMQKTPEVPKSTAEQAAQDVQNIASSVSAGIGDSVSPNVTTPAANPIKTNVNPYNNTNPFSGLKTNPFK